MITLTESAQKKIKELLNEENNPDIKLRIFVQGGGCSGMQYGFTFDEDQGEDDFEIEFLGSSLLVDSMSSQYLQNAVVDWKEDVMGSNFSIDNPNASTSCGCGSSFSID
jgi:iron-sulfur cluster insertion protein